MNLNAVVNFTSLLFRFAAVFGFTYCKAEKLEIMFDLLSHVSEFRRAYCMLFEIEFIIYFR